MKLAILSDTHGLLRPEVAELLKTAWSSTRPSTLSGATTTRSGRSRSPTTAPLPWGV